MLRNVEIEKLDLHNKEEPPVAPVEDPTDLKTATIKMPRPYETFPLRKNLDLTIGQIVDPTDMKTAQRTVEETNIEAGRTPMLPEEDLPFEEDPKLLECLLPLAVIELLLSCLKRIKPRG
jgi:hypothetical protein